jgi:cysteinyl-tRNA synthetase
MFKIYNTLTKRKEIFKPLKKGHVGIYTCGLTVYDYGHIGNFRAFVFADILRRWLESIGYKVKHVINFTDVGHMTFDQIPSTAGEDKVEKAAREQKKSPQEIANFYIKEFLKDSRALNLLEPAVRPRATQHIPQMIELIKKLIKTGYAYVSENGNVYFEVAKFKNYGKLSGNPLEQLMAGARLEPQPDKKHPYDFALWKRDPNHIMQWDSPWGRGFPGWHIECSAMSMAYLGPTIDIHTGGEDNIFPHHECEIAQSEAATGKQFVRYWAHVRHLLVNGQKMSKSLGNFYTLRDILAKGFSPKAVRFLLLSAHYRTPLNFTFSALKGAEETVKRLEDWAASLLSVKGSYKKKIGQKIKKTKRAIISAMNDDLNISLALSSLFKLMAYTNKTIANGKLDQKDAKDCYKLLLYFDKIMALDLHKVKKWQSIDEAKGKLKKMLEKRENLRAAKKWPEADAIREQLKKIGIIVEDTERGPRWRYK